MSQDLGDFLRRGLPRTMLPTPRPSDSRSNSNSYWLIDSPTQDLLAVMDACLHNLYDVPRAKGIFERMRQKTGNPALETRIYNAFLEAYLGMASSPQRTDQKYWIENLWSLYDAMESGRESITPSASTYALMLLAWHRYVPFSSRCADLYCSASIEPMPLYQFLFKRAREKSKPRSCHPQLS